MIISVGYITTRSYSRKSQQNPPYTLRIMAQGVEKKLDMKHIVIVTYSYSFTKRVLNLKTKR
jgi:hypothetical protein